MEQIESQRAQEEGTISLLDLISVVVKHGRFILLATVIAAVAVLALAIYTSRAPSTGSWNPLPNKYTPEVKVRLLESQSSSLSQALTSSALGSLAGLLGGSVSAGPSNADLAMALLKGNTLIDAVTKHFDFVGRYHIHKDPLTVSRAIFRGALKSKYDTTTGILTITYTDIDKQFATAVLSDTLNELQARFNALNLDQVESKKQFLEERLAAVQADLQNAQQRLIDFQVKYGIVDIQTQAQASVSEIASVNQQIQSKEIQLATLRHYGRGDNDPAVRQLETDIGILKNLANAMKNGSANFSVSTIPQDKLPEISAQYLNLKNDVTIQESVYTLLRQQYESAKIEETDTAKTFQVIERAEVPEVKSGPSRGKICIIVTITAFFLAIFASFVMEYFDRARQDPVESVKLAEIRSMLGFSRRKR